MVVTWQVLLLFLSSALLGEIGGWSANQYLGCLLTFVAAGCYSYIKAAAVKPAPAPVAPAEQPSCAERLSAEQSESKRLLAVEQGDPLEADLQQLIKTKARAMGISLELRKPAETIF